MILGKYPDEGYFYIPQLCTVLQETIYTESLKQYLLDQCRNKMKFSLYVYWIISSLCKQDNEKFLSFLSTIEMTLVNGIRKRKNKYINDKELYIENINKEFRANYYNICIKFYQNLKNICEKLKDFPIESYEPKKERKNILNIFLNHQNKKISELIEMDGIKEASSVVQAFYRGYILPFTDNNDILDEECYIIVKFNNKYCQCLSTKARVPCKIVFEVVKVKDLKYWDKYSLEHYISREGRLSNVNPKDCLLLENNNEGKENEKEIINEISLEEFLYNEEKEKDSNNYTHDSIEKITDTSSEKSEEMEKQRSFSVGGKDSINNLSGKKYYEFYNLINSKNKFGNPFGEKWLEICEKIKLESLYGNFPSHDIKSFIAKADDDLRQESLSMQLIKMMSDIFKKANIPLQLRTYEIIITSKNSGLIEFISDSISIDELKRKTYTDLNTFYRNFFENHFKEAQKNFVESLAAYSLVSYLLNLKDRHNGNIMIDIKGRIIHIDFGFILGISPGNVGFETAPFKMTKEYVNLLDGINSDVYNYFLLLLKKGFLELRKNYDSFVKVIEIMSKSKFNNF
jgi:phosphatidylinositol 4-kinase